MVSTNKTIVSRSCYEAPVCKLYSIRIEGMIAASPDGYGDSGEAGGDLSGGSEYDL